MFFAMKFKLKYVKEFALYCKLPSWILMVEWNSVLIKSICLYVKFSDNKRELYSDNVRDIWRSTGIEKYDRIRKTKEILKRTISFFKA